MLRAVLRAPRAAQIMPRSTAPARAMGGGGAHPPSPNHVWSPAGGWFVGCYISHNWLRASCDIT